MTSALHLPVHAMQLETGLELKICECCRATFVREYRVEPFLDPFTKDVRMKRCGTTICVRCKKAARLERMRQLEERRQRDELIARTSRKRAPIDERVVCNGAGCERILSRKNEEVGLCSHCQSKHHDAAACATAQTDKSQRVQ